VNGMGIAIQGDPGDDVAQESKSHGP
jgi:hypothetical protein